MTNATFDATQAENKGRTISSGVSEPASPSQEQGSARAVSAVSKASGVEHRSRSEEYQSQALAWLSAPPSGTDSSFSSTVDGISAWVDWEGWERHYKAISLDGRFTPIQLKAILVEMICQDLSAQIV